MNQRLRDQLVGFFGCAVIVGLALLAWGLAGGHLLLTRPTDEDPLGLKTMTKVF